MFQFNMLSALAAIVANAIVVAAPISLAGEASTYQGARWDPIHFQPAIDRATDEQCLACHQEIIERRVLEVAPAGVKASDALAWYQTLDTYQGAQETFHRRHLVTDYASRVMDLRCNFCHQGNDPREEAPNGSATNVQPHLKLRKHVDPDVCLMCHGKFNYAVMGVPGSWTEHGKLFNNNCLTCHAAIRTTRHQVNYLKPVAIEELAKTTNDVCFGCHGGRSWYRNHYPYPRNSWPGDGGVVPDWAKDRPTSSNPRYRIDAAAPAAQ